MKLNYFINNTLSADIAVDLGTDTTLIYIQGRGLVLKEPTCIACDIHTNEVQAVGEAAKQMCGKTPKCIEVIKPVENGVIANYEMTSKLLKSFLGSVCDKTVLKPRVIASVPSEATVVEQRAICDAFKEAGARDVFLIEAPLAAAAGAGCDISLARGMLIADIGGGRSNAASISLGASVIKKSIPVGGNTFDEEIIKYARKTHNLIIGSVTAENIKKEIGSVYPFEKPKTMTVAGCDAANGIPRSVTINSEELRDIFIPYVEKIAEMIKSVLEDTPPALQADIMEDGILITGGGAKIFGIEKYLRMETGLKVFVTENMDECVILGAGAELSKLDAPNAGRYFYSVYDI